MSFVGSMFGQNGTGLNYKAGSANILNPSTVAQADQTYGQSQDALAQQNALVQALQAQNGIQNQSQVFNQEQGVVNGTGPNPAQAQLAQATGANVANQAALAAGQRGSSANAGMIARQVGQQGAATQQNAIGQAATLQANQSLNALNASAGIAGQQVGQQQQATATQLSGAQAANQTVLNGINGQNQSNVAMQSNINNANAGIAGIAAGQQGQILGGLIGGAGTAAHLAKGGKVKAQPKMMAAGGPPSLGADTTFAPAPQMPASTAPAAPTVPMPVAQAPAASPSAKQGPMSQVGQHLAAASGKAPAQTGAYQAGYTIGAGLGKGIGALFGSSKSNQDPTTAPQGAPTGGANTGGAPDQFIPSNSDMGQANVGPQQWSGSNTSTSADPAYNGANYGHQDLSNLSSDYGGTKNPMSYPNEGPQKPMAKGGKVPAIVSPGEVYLPPNKVKEVKAKGNKPGDALKKGEKIPGKAKVKGDSYANDTVPRTLQEGGLVLPRSVTEAHDAPQAAARFVAAHMARGGRVRKF